MDNRKKRALNKPYRLFCLLTLLLCACTEVPEHCGDRYPSLNPSTQFCSQNGQPVNKGGETAACRLTISSHPGDYAGTVKVGGDDYTGPVNVNEGTEVSIIAAAGDGYAFKGWTVSNGSARINNEDSANTTVVLSGDATITACFTENNTTSTSFTLTVNYEGVGTVNVDGSDYTWPVNVNEGTEVSIIAAAGDGYAFTGWTVSNGSAQINNTGKASTTVSLSDDAAITATFMEIPATCDAAKNFCGNNGIVYENQWQCSNAVGEIQYTAAVGMPAGARVSGAVCMSADGGSFCQFGAKGCYELSEEYSSGIKSDGSQCIAGSCTCAEVLKSCEVYGSFYKDVTGLGEINNWGGDVTCAQQGGTLVGEKGPPEDCGGYCKWSTGCEAIVTDPTGAYGDPVETCAEAIYNCDVNGERYDNPTCSGTQVGGEEFCGSYCKYDGSTECVENKSNNNDPNSPTGVTSCTDAIANCDSYGARYDNPSCSGPPIGGAGSCDFYCKWNTTDVCEEIKPSGSGQRKSPPAPVPATAALGVSYADGKIGVIWSAGAEISGGTVELINRQGVTVSSGLVGVSGSKVTAGLGVGVVPAGMYFVRVSVKDVSGNKIEQLSPVNIVK
ncbi:MAG: hypothetical protein LBB74_04025 [Chitinispirillales bacterium]|jgi:hypothetical protein|nr:hypothetical protein [Chitinispirillales bacterium]